MTVETLSNGFKVFENYFSFLQSFPGLFPFSLGRGLLFGPSAGDLLVGFHHFEVRCLKMQLKIVATDRPIFTTAVLITIENYLHIC